MKPKLSYVIKLSGSGLYFFYEFVEKMEDKSTMQLRIWINVGEASGDVYGELLMRELARLAPGSRFQGMGGKRMRAAGLEAVGKAEELSVMGLTETLGHLPRVFELLERLRQGIRTFRPDVIVLIDCPDFHFQLAKEAKKLDIPVLYYVAPQAWAWRKGRVRFLRKFVKELLCILPFEEQFFKKHNVQARYVGHPLLNEIDFQRFKGVTPEQNQIGILPGSRKQEVSSLLPVFAQAARHMLNVRPDLRFCLMLASSIDRELIKQLWPQDIALDIFSPVDRHGKIKECSFVLAASGTVTLECALLGTPALVAYHVSPVTYFLGRMLVNVSYMALPNLILNEMVFPEFLQKDANGRKLATHGLSWLEDENQLVVIREKLAGLQKLLGQKNATVEVAAAVFNWASRQKEKI